MHEDIDDPIHAHGNIGSFPSPSPDAVRPSFTRDALMTERPGQSAEAAVRCTTCGEPIHRIPRNVSWWAHVAAERTHNAAPPAAARPELPVEGPRVAELEQKVSELEATLDGLTHRRPSHEPLFGAPSPEEGGE